jgi:hypothetical protein
VIQARRAGRPGGPADPEDRQTLAGDVSPRCNVIPALSPGRGRAKLKVATKGRLAPHGVDLRNKRVRRHASPQR